VGRRVLKVVPIPIFIAIAAFAALCIWWKTECDAQRAPCTVEFGPITLRISDETP
jgi:hypothetical protein